MQTQIFSNPLTATIAVGSGDLLGRRRIGVESMNNTTGEGFLFPLGAIDDASVELAEMLNYPGPIAVLVEALKREGVGINESSLKHEDVTHQNPYVAIIRGESAELLHRICESLKSGQATHQATQCSGLLVNSARGASGSGDVKALSELLHSVHNRSLPNEKS